MTAVVAVPWFLLGCVKESGELFFLLVFLLVNPLDVVFCCLDFTTPELFRFGDCPGDVVAFLFVPPGVITNGASVTAGVGEIIRLAEETILVAFPGIE